MARNGFYYENQHRDYPFLDQSAPLTLLRDESSSASSAQLLALPQATIVDFSGILGVHVDFAPATHWIWLHRIVRTDPWLSFDFRTNAPGGGGEALVFQFNINTVEENTSQWAVSVPIGWLPSMSSASSAPSSSRSSSSSGSAAYPFCQDGGSSTALLCDGPGCDGALWEGCLAVGRLTDLLLVLPTDTEWVFDRRLWVIEPGRIQSLRGAFVQSINLANGSRTTATPAADCSSAGDGAAAATTIPAAGCLQGALRFREGYNAAIRQETSANAIVLSAGVGAGAGEPCGEIPLTDGEESPDAGELLTGGPSCDEIVKSINGKSGPRLTIEAGAGFRIAVDPGDESTLIVEAVLDDFAACLADTSSSAGA